VSGLPEDVQAAADTLLSLVFEYQDVISLPDADRGILALAALTEHLERLERDLRLAWEVRDAYQFEKEQAEKERDEALEDLIARDALEKQ